MISEEQRVHFCPRYMCESSGPNANKGLEQYAYNVETEDLDTIVLFSYSCLFLSIELFTLIYNISKEERSARR